MPKQTQATAAHIYQDGETYRDSHVEYMYDAFFHDKDIGDITLANLNTYTYLFHGEGAMHVTADMFESLGTAHPFFTQFGHVTLLKVAANEDVPNWADGKDYKASFISNEGVHTNFQYADNLVNAGFLAYIQLLRHYVMEHCQNGALDSLSEGKSIN